MSGNSLPAERDGGGDGTGEDHRRLAVASALTVAGFDDVHVLPAETADEVLTPRRRTILQALGDREFDSQRELAAHLDFDPGNLARDLAALESANLVDIDDTGRTTSPSLRHETLIPEPVVSSRSWLFGDE